MRVALRDAHAPINPRRAVRSLSLGGPQWLGRSVRIWTIPNIHVKVRSPAQELKWFLPKSQKCSLVLAPRWYKHATNVNQNVPALIFTVPSGFIYLIGGKHLITGGLIILIHSRSLALVEDKRIIIDFQWIHSTTQTVSYKPTIDSTHSNYAEN